MTEQKQSYIVASGMDSGRKRLEPGEPFTGNDKSLPWLIEQGHVVAEGSAEHDALKAKLAAELEA